MPVPILRPARWKPSGNWSGKSCNIELTVQIWHHLIFTFLGHLRTSRREIPMWQGCKERGASVATRATKDFLLSWH
jgi:hypothetical protein